MVYKNKSPSQGHPPQQEGELPEGTAAIFRPPQMMWPPAMPMMYWHPAHHHHHQQHQQQHHQQQQQQHQARIASEVQRYPYPPLSFFSLVFLFPWCFFAAKFLGLVRVFCLFSCVFKGLRKVRNTLGVFEVFLGVFDKNKVKKDRAKNAFLSKNNLECYCYL